MIPLESLVALVPYVLVSLAFATTTRTTTTPPTTTTTPTPPITTTPTTPTTTAATVTAATVTAATATTTTSIDGSTLVATAKAHRLAQSRMWHALLHYEPRALGGVKSTQDAPGFFLAPGGKTDPEAELEASIRAFLTPWSVDDTGAATAGPPRAEHPQCRFPARFAWLREELDFASAGLTSVVPCPKFDWWKERLLSVHRSCRGQSGQSGQRESIQEKGRCQAAIDTPSVSLVFASAYLNNPASMFGHTFLRLNRQEHGTGSDLLTYVVNFAANPTTENALLYVLLGLFGGFPGTYSTMPYYLKVREYVSLEHRALFEYDLALTPAEVERMVQHLFELGTSWFDYYYLDENCSYHLLALLEAARPSLHLVSEFPYYATPADTVRAVLRIPGLVTERRHRPSQYDVMTARQRLLRGSEADAALALANDEKSPVELAQLPRTRKAAILDAAIELLRYRDRGKSDDRARAVEQELLLARGEVGVPSLPLRIENPGGPEEGHETALLELGGGYVRRLGPFGAVGSRIALHDLLGYRVGYVRGSQIEFLRFVLRFPLDPSADRRPELETLRLLRIVSLAPIDAWAFRWSWRLSTGFELLPQDPRAERPRRAFALQGGLGLSAALDPGQRVLAFVFLDTRAGIGPAFEHSWQVTAGAAGGLLAELVPEIRLLAEASWLYRNEYRVEGGVAVNLLKDLELRMGWKHERSGATWSLGGLFYY